MGDRVLGPSESKRRHFWRYRFFILPVVAITAAAFFITSASAVHDLGVFELDRNVRDPNGAPLPDDWATLYAGGSNDGGSPEVFTGIAPDSGDQFQGGGSKDNNEVGGPDGEWLWKAGEPLDKDDITNAYAAGYIYDGEASGLTEPGDFIVYFGLDRLANNGSAQVGFWFFKDEITQTMTPRGGGFEFDGTHTVGDVLVQSNFSQGGVVDSVTVFEWVGSGGSHGSLNQLFDSNDDPFTDCLTLGLVDDLACATVNQGDTPTPWPYTPKFGTSGIFPRGSFFEGGINLTQLVPSAGCISTFIAETRTSTPFDARLKDLALDDFDTCEVDITTQASPKRADGDQTPGVSATDTATVTGSSLIGGDVPTPTGHVRFFLCDPDEITTNVGCDTGDGDQVGDPVLLDETVLGTATATSSAASGDDTSEVGTYCWRAVYEPDANSSYDSAEFTNFTDECFTIAKVDTNTATKQFVYPQDKAKITVPSGVGGDPTGTVTFELFDSLAACNGTAEPPVDPVHTEENVALTATAPFTAKTNNTSYAINDAANGDSPPTHYWKVSFTSTNPAQNDSVSACEESTAVTFEGDDHSINVPDEPSP